MDDWDTILSLAGTIGWPEGDDDLDDEVSSQEWFEDAVWDAMGMDVTEFLRRLDSGEWDEVMENEEYRHLRQLAEVAERFR